MWALPTGADGRGRTESFCCQNAYVTTGLRSSLIEHISTKSYKMLAPIHGEQEILVISYLSAHHPVD